MEATAAQESRLALSSTRREQAADYVLKPKGPIGRGTCSKSGLGLGMTQRLRVLQMCDSLEPRRPVTVTFCSSDACPWDNRGNAGLF